MSMPMGSDAPDAAVAARVAAAWAALLPAVLQRQGTLLAVKDLATGRYEHLNAAMSDFLGRGGLSALGRTDAEIFDPPLLTALRAAEQTALAQRGPLASEHRFEWAGVRHDFLVWRCGGESAGAAAGWPAPGSTRVRSASARHSCAMRSNNSSSSSAPTRPCAAN
jgi:hypothetical protein